MKSKNHEINQVAENGTWGWHSIAGAVRWFPSHVDLLREMTLLDWSVSMNSIWGAHHSQFIEWLSHAGTEQVKLWQKEIANAQRWDALWLLPEELRELIPTLEAILSNAFNYSESCESEVAYRLASGDEDPESNWLQHHYTRIWNCFMPARFQHAEMVAEMARTE